MVQNGRGSIRTACSSVKECTAFDSINLDHNNRINDLACFIVFCCQKSSDIRVVCLVTNRFVMFALTVATSAASAAFSSVSVTGAIKAQLLLAEDLFAFSNCDNFGTICWKVTGLITVDTPMRLSSNILSGLIESPVQKPVILIILSFWDVGWLSRLDLAFARFNYWIDVLPTLKVTVNLCGCP